MPTDSLEFEIDCQIEPSQHNERYRHILGARNTVGDNDFALMVDAQNNYTFRFEYGGIEGNNVVLSDISALQKNHIEFKNRSLKINGSNYGTVPYFNFTLNREIYLFLINDDNFMLRNLKLKLYGCKFYDNNEIIREFVPCYRKADNKPGLYDLVNDQFYTNIGTDYDFELPVRLPSEYTQVDFIKSTGTQFIDTLIIPTNDLGFELECQIESSSNQQRYRHLMGSRISAGNNDFALMVDTQSSYSFRFEYGGINGNNVLLPNISALQKNNIVFKNRVLKINGSSYGTVPNFNFSSNTSIYLFTLNTNGNSELRNLRMKLFRCKFYQGNQLIADFVPCCRVSDSKPGLYNTVNNRFYTNNTDQDYFSIE